MQSQIVALEKDTIQIEHTNITTEQAKQDKQAKQEKLDKKDKKCKKNKKRKKSSYKKLLRSMIKSTKTDEQKKNDYTNRLSKSLGGGRFNKIDNI
jgi:hypothetical protein